MSNKIPNKPVKPLQPVQEDGVKDRYYYMRYYGWLSKADLNENIMISLTALPPESYKDKNRESMHGLNIMSELIDDIYEDIREIRKSIFKKYMAIKRLKIKLDIYMKDFSSCPVGNIKYQETTKIADRIIDYFMTIDSDVNKMKEMIESYNDAVDIYNSEFKKNI